MKWYEAAACKGMDINIFFPPKADFTLAREVCASCHVVQECLDAILWRENDNFGMFGGLTPPERHQERIRRWREQRG